MSDSSNLFYSGPDPEKLISPTLGTAHESSCAGVQLVGEIADALLLKNGRNVGAGAAGRLLRLHAIGFLFMDMMTRLHACGIGLRPRGVKTVLT